MRDIVEQTWRNDAHVANPCATRYQFNHRPNSPLGARSVARRVVSCSAQSMTATEHGVRARGVRKVFNGGTHSVLRGVEIDLNPGEVVGLIGPNGAGKSTLMSCLLGFLHTDEGEISFDGLRNDDLSVRRRTGFVPERMNLGRREPVVRMRRRP